MGGRFLTIALLCLLGMGLGTAYTWVNAQNDQAGSLASLEPAAGVAGGADIGGSFTLTDQNGNTLSSSDIDKYKLDDTGNGSSRQGRRCKNSACFHYH